MATQLAPQDDRPMTFNQALTGFRADLERRANEFKMVLPAHISPEKLQRTIITAIQSDPDLLRADRQSLLLACMKAAQDGLLPDKREAALVIFNERKNVGGQWVDRKTVQYMPMVYGLRKKILQSGKITGITCSIVYRAEVENGYFVYEEGTEATLRHKPMLDLTEEQAKDDQIVAAYSMATLEDGSKSYEVMRRFEIDKVRESSQTGATRNRKGEPRTPKGPWVDWYPEQAKKTVMRRHAKTLPMSGDLIDVEARDDALYAASTTAMLGTVAPDPPATAPSRAQLAGADAFEQAGGEEDRERALDADSFVAMERREADETDDQRGEAGDNAAADDEGGADDHPSGVLATELVERLDRAEVVGDVVLVEGDLGKHEKAMREGDVERVKLAIAQARLRFGGPADEPAQPAAKAKRGEAAAAETAEA